MLLLISFSLWGIRIGSGVFVNDLVFYMVVGVVLYVTYGLLIELRKRSKKLKKGKGE